MQPFGVSSIMAHRIETWLQGAGSLRLFVQETREDGVRRLRARRAERARLTGLDEMAALEAEHQDHMRGAFALLVGMLIGMATALAVAMRGHEVVAGALACGLHLGWAYLQMRTPKGPSIADGA